MAGRVLGFLAVVAVLVGVLLWSQERVGPLRVSGFIEADVVRVASRVGGRVRAVHAAEGESVTSGQLLVELDPFDLLAQRAAAEAELASRRAVLARLAAGARAEELVMRRARVDQRAARVAELTQGPRSQEIEAARARVRRADAALELARVEYERAQGLVAASAASRDELDRALRALDAAREERNALAADLALLEAGTRVEVLAQGRAEEAAARAELALAEAGARPEELDEARAGVAAAQATLDALDVRIAELRVTAPCDGVVEALDLRPGATVGPDAPVLSLLDPARLWVRAYVPEDRLDFRPGRRVGIRVDAFPGRTFAGEVSFVAREAEFVPGNVQTPEERVKQVFRIKVDLRDGLDVLRPGVPADVLLEDGE